MLDGRSVAEHAEGLGRVQDAVEGALLARPEERDPVRLPRPRGGAPRETRERAEPERGGGDGEQPEPPRMAEGGGVGLSPCANGFARVVLRHRLVHRLNVRGPGTERFDLAEQGTHHRILRRVRCVK